MVNIIVAKSLNNAIGKNGIIPWKIKGEQKQFKNLTENNIVVMGRKTYEDIGHPLPNRQNVVISRTKLFEGENLETSASLTDAINKYKDKEIFVSGGERLFREAIPIADKMYITEVDTIVENADAFFPTFDKNDFDVTFIEEGGEEIKYRRYLYTRNRM